ncbi:uncharacterized protein METZ01_LOCUS38801 [marine metagenome]|uniref:TRAM domain-containing protein n=1 Tax=marine metagenome TaxID=408172 RepID=A0A381R7U9_9ZZZZ|tara:strand:- start:157 stop:1545 length:1389 start_codon:yes stop_codon:yes gene_type:complete
MRKRKLRTPQSLVEPKQLHVSRLSPEGRGISHQNGEVIFVDGALPGEDVIATYARKNRHIDEFRVIEVLSASPERVEPPCLYASCCGGCSLQHVGVGAQLDFKELALGEHLEQAIGAKLTNLELLPQLKGGSFHYRRKARLAVRMVEKKGGALVGFREKYGTFITDMESCQVMVKEVADLILPLRTLITMLQGNKLIPQIEVAVGEYRDKDNSVEDVRVLNKVALVFRHLKPLCQADIQALCDFSQEYSIDLYLQPRSVDSVYKRYPEKTVERLQYFLPDFDLTLNFHPMDFTQVNAEINQQIVKQAVRLLNLEKEDRVLDLFCGLGNFTLAIARYCREVVGVEGNHDMVKRGEENSLLNKISNATFHQANLNKNIENKCWLSTPFTKILIDPPRSGAFEIITQIASLRAERIVYVSCNLATLAKDAALLVEEGYRLKSYGVVDMFPHTAHVESMVQFELMD